MNTDIKKVEGIARSIMGGENAIRAERGSYLKTLLAEVQSALSKGADKQEALAAIRAAHEPFYAACMRVADDIVPKGIKSRAVALHAKCNFARTAFGVLRRYVKAGNDLVAVKVESATKESMLAKCGPLRERSIRTPKFLRKVIAPRAKAVLQLFAELGKADKAAALEELSPLVTALTKQLRQIENKIASKAKPQAAETEYRVN